ncbi:MAG: glycosyltransferase family 4 protein [Xylella fastidiosa subsp. multiplex]
MRIVMDLQGAQSEGSRHRGIGRYTLSLAMAAARNHRGHDIHLILNGAFAEQIPVIRQAFEGLLPQVNIHVFHVPLPIKEMKGANARAEQIREAAIAALAPDVVHVSSMFEGYGDNAVTSVGQFVQIPTVVTFYDMIPWIHRNIYLDPAPAYRNYYERKLTQLRCADALVGISESSCAEAVNVMRYDAKRVFNISAACDSIFVSLSRHSHELQMVLNKFGLDGNFILYTGGSDERKNLQRLIDAYARLEHGQRTRCRLVLAGRMPDHCVKQLLERATAVGLTSGEVIFTGYISDHDLVALYNLCCFFIFPSWHEGFGLPVLEAMSCGAAVLVSGVSSIPEIVHYPDAFFDPFDVDSICDRMAHFLDHAADLEELRRYCLERAGEFSWDAVALRFLKVCEQVGKYAVCPGIPEHDVLLRSLEHRLIELGGGETSTDLFALADAIDRSVPPPVPKIMVDVTQLALLDFRTGIQRVTRAIVLEWQRQPPEGYVIQLVRMDLESCTYVCANAYAAELTGTGKVIEDTPLVCHSGDVFLGLDLVNECIALLPDWFQYLRNAGVRIAFVIYDILPVRRPDWWQVDGAYHHERWLREVVGVSEVLLCISHATADDVLAWMDEQQLQKRPDVRWFHLGADIQSSLPSQGMLEHEHSVLEQLNGRVSFLMVGTLEPRKGYAQILRAFDQLWAAEHDVMLVIVGKIGWLVDALCEELKSHSELNHRLFWFVGASDELLGRLYSACSCLIAASEGEGFGLPLIEAAQHQLPVIARDIPVFREVAGEYAAYFSGTAPEQARDAILDWIVLYREQRYQRSDVMSWLTWRESAADLAAVLFEDTERLVTRENFVKDRVGEM